ncbi:MAG: TerB family tellurite resistance protein [Zavarzinella sp.]
MRLTRELKEKLLADGRINSAELALLADLLYADSRIDREEAEFLIELHKRVERVSPGFEKFFFKAIKDHVLEDGAISAEETDWLRKMIFADGRVDEREKKLLRELRGEATQKSPEFEALYAECLN